MNGPIASAREAWGVDAPDWVMRLAQSCEASSQSRVAAQLGYTPAVISQVVRKKYTGNFHNVRERVEGQLMGATLVCPALGNLPLHECQAWRAKARHFSGANHQRVLMFRACSRCPNNRQDNV
ncbi:hypothetical protein [Yoonia sp. R2-816]|uniref:hypothetical protein n=1 Tax=Yoonia sp. R2-816 TaxID=3342638 RepID=UPI00372C9359